MKPIRKILVPTDFSPDAEEAFRHAVMLAKATGAGVVVVHVAQPPTVVIDGGRLCTNPTVAPSADLWEEIRKLKADDPSVAVEHEVIVADRLDVSHVLRIVEAAGCDLIVMGTHGMTGLRQRLFGTLTEQVVRLARCPVMVVKGLAPAEASREPEPSVREPIQGPEAVVLVEDPELAPALHGEYLG